MHTLKRRRCLGIAAAGAFFALTTVGLPARADELVQHLGPVPPHEPILTTFGNKRVIAFYEPDNGRCAVNAIVYDKTDADTGMTTAARVRVSLIHARWCISTALTTSRSTFSAATERRHLPSSTAASLLPLAYSTRTHP